eukprot:COSAG01_NODE_1092_length_11738_cov_18.025775_1_plen_318_part_00
MLWLALVRCISTMVALCSRRRRRRLGVVLGHISPFSGAPCSGSGELPLLLSAQRLSGKVCLVTGGASGIGRAICERLAREGASLAVLDTRLTPREGGATVLELATAARRQQQGEKDEECLVRSSGGAATHRNAEEEEDLFIKGSVTDAETVKAAMQAVVARFGRLDVLVNNAAILASSPLLETSEEEWDMFMAVNAKGAFLCLKVSGQLVDVACACVRPRPHTNLFTVFCVILPGSSRAVHDTDPSWAGWDPWACRQHLISTRHGGVPRISGVRREQGCRSLHDATGGCGVHRAWDRRQRSRARAHHDRPSGISHAW